MSWLGRLFGLEKPEDAAKTAAAAPAADASVPAERVGLHGEFDQSGLAKRVAAAFDADAELDDVNSLYIAQTGSTVVLKGSVPSQHILDKMVTVAKAVHGAASVETNQVTVG